MLLGTLGASVLGNMLAGKEVTRAGEGTVMLAMDLHLKNFFDSTTSFNKL